jgi:hypothetical protein
MKNSEYRIPKKIKIGGFYYNVVFPYVFDENTDYLGLHDTEDLEIRITKYHHGLEVKVQRVHETVIHELLHGLSHVYCETDVVDSESIISRLSCGLYQVLRDNKNFTVYGKLNMPKTLRIGPFDIKVIYPFEFKDTNNNCSYRTTVLEFRVDNRKRLEYAMVDLITGILYTICDNVCIEEDQDINATQIRQLSTGLYQMLRDNKIEYMVRGK